MFIASLLMWSVSCARHFRAWHCNPRRLDAACDAADSMLLWAIAMSIGLILDMAVLGAILLAN